MNLICLISITPECRPRPRVARHFRKRKSYFGQGLGAYEGRQKENFKPFEMLRVAVMHKLAPHSLHDSIEHCKRPAPEAVTSSPRDFLFEQVSRIGTGHHRTSAKYARLASARTNRVAASI